MRLVSVAIMKDMETRADKAGLSYAEMMQRAGNGLAEIVDLTYGSASENRVVGLIGPGNNGGDTLVSLTWLAQNGWEAAGYLAKPRPEGDKLVSAFIAAGGKIIQKGKGSDYSTLDEAVQNATVLLDGLLGTGFELPLKADIVEVLAHLKANPLLPHVVAVDCPSGVNCDSGEMAAETLPAELTITMAAVKKGLLQFPAYGATGRIEVVDLGFGEVIPEWLELKDEVVTELEAAPWLPQRPLDAHKGTFGTALLAVGSINFTGAALLAGKAALRSGVGLVRMAIPGSLHTTLAGHLPEAVWTILPHELGVISADAVEVLLKDLENVKALLLGCGWGREETTAEFLKLLLTEQGGKVQKPAIGFMAPGHENDPRGKAGKAKANLPPMVIDADGLRLLAKMEHWEKFIPAGTIFTPHPGELAELCGLTVEQIQADRIETARKYAQKWEVVLVLKGALTVIASPEGVVRVIPAATSALSHAGTGDVLAGLITGLLAQGIAPYDAAALGAWLHAQAGMIVEEIVGHPASVTAGDVVDEIGEAFQLLQGEEQE